MIRLSVPKRTNAWPNCIICLRKVYLYKPFGLLGLTYSEPSENLMRAESRALAQKQYYQKANQIFTQMYNDGDDVFPFLALPAELRLAVYFELLVSDDRLVTTWRGPRKAHKQQKRMFIDILLTCRLCWSEGVGVLYGENVFDFGERFFILDHGLLTHRALTFLGIGSGQDHLSNNTSPYMPSGNKKTYICLLGDRGNLWPTKQLLKTLPQTHWLSQCLPNPHSRRRVLSCRRRIGAGQRD